MKEIALERINLTLWSTREDDCKSLRKSWFELIKTRINQRGFCEEPETRNEATGILLSPEKLET